MLVGQPEHVEYSSDLEKVLYSQSQESSEETECHSMIWWELGVVTEE